MAQELAIEARGLEKSYGAVRVLDGVDITVPRGSVFALLGPNGSGKTTTVRILATLTGLDAGQAAVGGFDVVRERRKVRRIISLTGQFVAIDGFQSGAENLRMMGRLGGLSPAEARSRADHLLERFDLVEAGGRRVSTYSGGMRRRLDLAASLVGQPSVIFLDEPTTGLDPRSRQEMWTVIGDLARAGLTVFLTTQYLEEADRLADRVAVLSAGKIVAEGTPDELKQQVSGQRLMVELVDDAAYEAVRRALGDRVGHTDAAERTLGVATDGSAAQVRALLDEIDPDRALVARFSVQRATLDEVFIALTGKPAPPPANEDEKEPIGV
jgi:ABC-2 type transport system ATP-binding protein